MPCSYNVAAMPTSLSAASRRRSLPGAAALRALPLLGLALGLLLGLAGCGTPPANPLPGLYGQVVAGSPVVLVPGQDWEVAPAGEGWVFRGQAELLCYVQHRPRQGLTVLLTPDPDAAGKLFELRWDDQVLVAETELPPPGLELAVEPGRLQPGHHRLQMRRIYRRGAGNGHENRLIALGYRLDGKELRFASQHLASYRYLADFLALGVTGLDRVQRGGLLFQGPRERSVELAPAAGSYLQVVAENASGDSARFRLQAGGHDYQLAVPPGSRRPLRVPLPAGRQEVRLAVEGSADGLFLWGEPALEAAGKPAAELPPVFLITLDTTRRDALGAYSGQAELTPFLDRFASTATVFEHAYATAPWTLPSHASIMTGLYPSHHGAGVTDVYLRREVPTLASLLRARGYFTAGVAGGNLATHRFGLSQGFAVYRDPDGFETVGDRLTDYVATLLGQHRRQPLFVFANYFDPHALYQAPKKFERRLQVGQHRQALVGHPVWQRFDRGDLDAWREIIDGADAADEGIRAYARAAYLAEVAFMDEQLGRLFDTLKDLDLYDRALIVVVADHGELLGEHGGLFSHAGRLDPELTEIPLLIKWPHQREGRRVSAPVSQVDLFATVLDATGQTPPSHDGRALAPAATAKGDDGRRYFFLEEHQSRIHPLPPRLTLGPSVYGLQWPLRRQIVWPGGGECARREQDGWLAEACATDSAVVLRRIEQVLGEKARVDDAGVMSRQDEAGLRALGYL